jgi:hypothetical protein
MSGSEGGIRVDEGWLASTGGCNMFACYDPTDGSSLAVMRSGLSGRERLSLADSGHEQECGRESGRSHSSSVLPRTS